MGLEKNAFRPMRSKVENPLSLLAKMTASAAFSISGASGRLSGSFTR
jgi:hypothetical protein